MSKNIMIQEGGIGKQITVKKLKTDKVGGGACLWVPEEEVALGTKSISANGTYKASDDGKYGFSQVTVNVAGGKGSADSSGKPISSGGDPDIGSSFIGVDPTDGEPYEYTVNPQGEVEKTPVSTATPSDIGSSFIGIDPTDGEPYEYTVNPQGEVEKTPVPTVAPGGIGTSVIGKDTSGVISGVSGGDGNEYAIGIDSNGSIVATKVPSGIEIGKAPDKTSYTDGETIDYSGIIVILKGGDSAIFSNTDYPNGRVPVQQLTFPVSIASEGSGVGASLDGFSFDSSGYTQTVISLSEPGSAGAGHYSCTIVQGLSELSWNGTVFARGQPIMSSEYWPRNMRYKLVNGQVYDEWSYPNKPGHVEQHRISAADSYVESESNSIPVKWTSPYDGRTFEDTFEITVTGDTSGDGGDSDDGKLPLYGDDPLYGGEV